MNRAVHGPERIVKVRGHDPIRRRIPQRPGQEAADEGNGPVGIRDLPAHHDHEAEPEKQEDQTRDRVLDADRLVIGGKDELPQET
jgi:hypothetical protein